MVAPVSFYRHEPITISAIPTNARELWKYRGAIDATNANIFRILRQHQVRMRSEELVLLYEGEIPNTKWNPVVMVLIDAERSDGWKPAIADIVDLLMGDDETKEWGVEIVEGRGHVRFGLG